MDEFVVGMIVDECNKIIEIFKCVVKICVVVVVEYDMEFICNFECKVICLYEGLVLVEGLLDFVIFNKDVIDVYLGC